MNIKKHLSCHHPEMGLPGNWTRAWQLLQKGWKGGCPVRPLGGICSLVPGYIPETTVLGDVSPCWFDVWNKFQTYSYYMDVVVKCHGGLILSEIICWTKHLKKRTFKLCIAVLGGGFWGTQLKNMFVKLDHFPKFLVFKKSQNVSNLVSMVLFGASISWTLQKVRISERKKVAEKDFMPTEPHF